MLRLDDAVSIHAPREGCDGWMLKDRALSEFQFTHPGRGATVLCRAATLLSCSFNSRTPGGVRLGFALNLDALDLFQFTHPGRGATVLNAAYCPYCYVSIHAPREGCDSLSPVRLTVGASFNSRTPGGVRHNGLV